MRSSSSLSVTRSIGWLRSDERHHAIEDAAVRVAEERARVDDRRGDVERFVVDQDRAEDRALRVEIVRKRAFSERRVAVSATTRMIRAGTASPVAQ